MQRAGASGTSPAGGRSAAPTPRGWKLGRRPGGQLGSEPPRRPSPAPDQGVGCGAGGVPVSRAEMGRVGLGLCGQ